jgi:hypothetical protein
MDRNRQAGAALDSRSVWLYNMMWWLSLTIATPRTRATQTGVTGQTLDYHAAAPRESTLLANIAVLLLILTLSIALPQIILGLVNHRAYELAIPMTLSGVLGVYALLGPLSPPKIRPILGICLFIGAAVIGGITAIVSYILADGVRPLAAASAYGTMTFNESVYYNLRWIYLTCGGSAILQALLSVVILIRLPHLRAGKRLTDP